MSNTAALLKHLAENPYLSNAQLSEALGLSMSTTSSLTTQMYGSGKLDRKDGDPSDTKGNRPPPFLYFVPEKPAGKRELAKREQAKRAKTSKKAAASAAKPVEPVASSSKRRAGQVRSEPATSLAALLPNQTGNSPLAVGTPYDSHLAHIQTAMAGTLDTLVRGLAQQIALGVQVALVEELAKLSNMTTVSSPLLQGAIKEFNKPHEQREVRPKVVIAGLLPNQAGIIAAEYGEVFNLDFYMVGESLQQFRDKLTNADYAITFARKIGHKVEDVVKERGLTPIRFSGGINRLKDLLLELYTNGKVEA